MAAPAAPDAPVITLAQARQHCRGLSTDDVEAQLYIDAATQVVEGLVGPLVLTQLTWSFDGGIPSIALPWAVNTAYDMQVMENTALSTDYYLSNDAAVLHSGLRPGTRIWTSGLQNVWVTAWVGRDVIPAPWLLAVKEELSHLWRVGRQGVRPTFGPQDASAQPVLTGFAVPHRVTELCQAMPHLPRVAGFA